jgi:predicted HTH transcriptional regulator
MPHGDDGIDNGIEVGVDNGIDKSENVVCLILEAITENPKITQKQLSANLGVSVRTIARELKSLQEEGKIRRVGSDRAGYWSVN